MVKIFSQKYKIFYWFSLAGSPPCLLLTARIWLVAVSGVPGFMLSIISICVYHVYIQRFAAMSYMYCYQLYFLNFFVVLCSICSFLFQCCCNDVMSYSVRCQQRNFKNHDTNLQYNHFMNDSIGCQSVTDVCPYAGGMCFQTLFLVSGCKSKKKFQREPQISDF